MDEAKTIDTAQTMDKKKAKHDIGNGVKTLTLRRYSTTLQMLKPNVKTSEEMISEKGWAWMVLLGGFLVRCFTDGLIGSLGIFILAWQEYFAGSLSQLTWITSLIAGLNHMNGPLGSVLLKRFSIRQVVMAGAILTSTSFIAASFATQLWHLYLTSTVAGIGFGLIYTPSLVVLTYYFDSKLGRVGGVASCGSAVGMLVLPSLFRVLISYYNWQGAILILAGLVANIGICGALFRPTSLEIKVRTRIQELPSNIQSHNNKDGARRGKIDKILKSIVEAGDLVLFKNVYFLFGLIAFFLYGLGYIIFTHYLSSKAVNLGFSKQNAAFLISSVGIGSGVSRLTHGIIIDRHILSASVLTSLSYIVCGVSNLLIPVSDKFPVLVTLAVVIGVSSGVFHSTFPIVAIDYVGIDHVACGLGWLMFVFGAGNIFGAYLTGVLVDATGNYDFPFYLAGICFIICALFTSAKPLTENLKHIYSIMMRRAQKGTQKEEVDGVINRGADIDGVINRGADIDGVINRGTDIDGVINRGADIGDGNIEVISRSDFSDHVSSQL